METRQLKNKRIRNSLRQQLKQMLGWTPEFQNNIDAGKPFIKESHGILALHFDGMSIQSEMSIEQPDKLVLSYTRTMMSFLLFEPEPKSIAMIGLGGGSLAKYCYRHLPQTKITVAEINPDVIALRNEFAIPADDARFRILANDGAAFVSATDDEFEVLMVDGFDTSGLPTPLSSQEFYEACFAALPEHGILVVNLWGSHAHYHECMERIHNSFSGNLLVVSADEDPNKIVFAVKAAHRMPSPETLRHHADTLSCNHPLDFHTKAKKLLAALPVRAELAPV